MSEKEQYVLSPAQGVQLMALSEMIRAGDLDFRGHSDDEAAEARALIADVAQEIALQVSHG